MVTGCEPKPKVLIFFCSNSHHQDLAISEEDKQVHSEAGNKQTQFPSVSGCPVLQPSILLESQCRPYHPHTCLALLCPCIIDKRQTVVGADNPHHYVLLKVLILWSRNSSPRNLKRQLKKKKKPSQIFFTYFRGKYVFIYFSSHNLNAQLLNGE